MEDDVAVGLAEPSAAEVAEPQQNEAPPPIESWSGAQRDEWLKTGQPPKQAAEPEKSASEAEKPKAQGAPEAPQDQQGRRKPTAEQRIAELTRARRETERELENLRMRFQEAVAPRPEPAKVEVKPPEPDGKPKKPQLSQFETLEQYESAEEHYFEKLADWKVEQREQARAATEAKAAEQRFATQAEQMRTSTIERGRSQYQDWDDVIDASTAELTSDMVVYITAHKEHGPALAYHFAHHPEDAVRISEYIPQAQHRELNTLAEKLLSSANRAPEPKKITSAAKPPTELGGRATVPEDEAAAALKVGDFARYKAVMNAREMKRAG